MWPLNILKKTREERRLKKKCLDEIIETLRQRMIETSDLFIGPFYTDFLGPNGSLRSLLESKRLGKNYRIEVIIGSEGFEEGYKGIGYAPNPEFLEFVNLHKDSPEMTCPQCDGYGSRQVSSENGVPGETCDYCEGSMKVDMVAYLSFTQNNVPPKKLMIGMRVSTSRDQG